MSAQYRVLYIHPPQYVHPRLHGTIQPAHATVQTSVFLHYSITSVFPPARGYLTTYFSQDNCSLTQLGGGLLVEPPSLSVDVLIGLEDQGTPGRLAGTLSPLSGFSENHGWYCIKRQDAGRGKATARA